MKIMFGALRKWTMDIMGAVLVACMLVGNDAAKDWQLQKPVLTKCMEFKESDRELHNPNQGFYMMYGFTPSDKDEEFQTVVQNRLEKDSRTLAMIQINLKNYTECPISKQGLDNIRDIFIALEKLEKQYIVRFLYDWDGTNEQTEPQNAEIILEHMRQLEDIFREYQDIIFVQQGLFIGNWGEMNGTAHLDSMTQLALQLEAVTGEKTYLAVRMPAQWRTVTGFSEITEEVFIKSALVRRLGLYNDGMMGNTGDYGTYGTKSRKETGEYGLWNRAEELAFQEELCKFVPNGGEVIINNSLNDFEAAVETLRQMHVTYLNWDYDRNVLNKWAASTVKEQGVFHGMDGLTYMQRHLGYRLLIKEASLEYNTRSGEINIGIDMQNVGFAPMYKKPELMLKLRFIDTEEERSYIVEEDLRTLSGGTGADEVLTVSAKIATEELEEGRYDVFFLIKDTDSNRYIELAIEQEMQDGGYKIGELYIGEGNDL